MRKKLNYFIVLCICIICLFPFDVKASTKEKISYGGKVYTFSDIKTEVYVNGKKINLSKRPVFLKSGSYMGTVTDIFKKSSLKVKVKKSGNTMTLTYGSRSIKMTAGKKSAVVNGKKNVVLYSAPLQVTYVSRKDTRWVVPLHSVCTQLGISYKLEAGKIMIGKDSKAATTTQGKSTTSSTTTQARSTTTSATTQARSTTTSATTQVKNTTTSTTTQAKTTTQSVKPASSAGTSLESSKVVVVLDVGHGGRDSGAVGQRYREKTLALSIVLAAKKQFDKDDRFKVYYTRTTDTYPTLRGRCEFANSKNADLFISVHINSAGTTATGTETIYRSNRCLETKKNQVTSLMLAQEIQKGAVSATGFRNRGVKDDERNLCVLRETLMPACLVEYGFISNPLEEIKMYANTTKYGNALYQSIVNFAKNNRMF